MQPNLQERIAQRFKSRADEIAKKIAEAWGNPSDAQEISEEEEVRLWNFRNQQVDPTELLQQGMPIDQIVDQVFPNRRHMTVYRRPNPADQVKYAQRMHSLTEKHGEQPGDFPTVVDESGGERTSTVEAY